MLEDRLCECGNLQTEQHVLDVCPRTQHLRDMFGFATIQQASTDFTHESHVKYSLKYLGLMNDYCMYRVLPIIIAIYGNVHTVSPP